MPHTRNRTWVDVQKKLAGFHHPVMRGGHDTGWIPNADVIEHDDSLMVRMELAGVASESIHITIAQAVLLVAGHRLNPHTGGTASGYRFRQMEIEYGPFERVMPLPFPVDRKEARARIANGMLEILLPRATRASRRQTVIEIQW